MSNRNLSIDLKSSIDKNGKTYYIGKIEAPIMIDCSKGATFLIFVSESGSEVLQVAPMVERRND
jgi:hypothetical protein